MITTGIVRRFDDLGRIVIPKEIREKAFGKKGCVWNAYGNFL
nr:MAG TPA: stage V sporulation protein T [Caudoviricetes sp.]